MTSRPSVARRSSARMRRSSSKPLETRLVPVSATPRSTRWCPRCRRVLSSRGSCDAGYDGPTRSSSWMWRRTSRWPSSWCDQLDSQTPQVLIEARIVEARTNYLRQLGIQWGFDYIGEPVAQGTPPGSCSRTRSVSPAVVVTRTGQSSEVHVDCCSTTAARGNPNYAVDLPAPVGTNNGWCDRLQRSVASPGNLNTNLRLSPLQRTTGEVRIISRSQDRHLGQHPGPDRTGCSDSRSRRCQCSGCQYSIRQRDVGPSRSRHT